MFKNLVESGSHHEDFRRKGSFFLGTLVLYTVLMSVAGVVSIHAYKVHLDSENVDVIPVVAPPPVQSSSTQKVEKSSLPKVNNAKNQQAAIRPALIAPIAESTKPPAKISTERLAIPEMPRGIATIVGHGISDPTSSGGPVGPLASNNIGSSIGRNSGGNIVNSDEADLPPPPKSTPTPPKKLIIASTVLNGMAISKPAPPYPQIAKAVHASGLVTVQILIDEMGRVVSAHATSGHPLLQDAAVKAAYQARFSPTLLNGQPVKVSGVITYNFVLQ